MTAERGVRAVEDAIEADLANTFCDHLRGLQRIRRQRGIGDVEVQVACGRTARRYRFRVLSQCVRREIGATPQMCDLNRNVGRSRQQLFKEHARMRGAVAVAVTHVNDDGQPCATGSGEHLARSSHVTCIQQIDPRVAQVQFHSLEALVSRAVAHGGGRGIAHRIETAECDQAIWKARGLLRCPGVSACMASADRTNGRVGESNE